MRKSWLLPLGIGCLSILNNPVHAQTAPAPAGVTVQSQEVFNYDRIFQAFKATRFSSLSDVRANSARLDGRVIELQGELLGITTSPAGYTLLLKVDNEAAVLTVKENIVADVALQPGTSVRTLVRVASIADDVTLTILAATGIYSATATAATAATVDSAAPEPPALYQAPDSDATGVLVVPPMTTMIVPNPPAPSAPKRAPRPGSRTTKSTPAANTPIAIDASKPAYKALVRRFNSNLREDQVDEIATALLTAGYSHNMDPRFLAAMVAVESSFNPNSVSRSGALGLGQLMPFNLKPNGVSDPYNPTQSIMGMARMLRRHLDEYSTRPNSTLLAVAAYNAGSGAVRRAGYQVPPTSQVQRYVWKVYYRYKDIAPDMFQ